MAFTEEEPSTLAKLIGKRWPLAVILILATVVSMMIKDGAAFSAFIVLDTVIIKAYYDALNAPE